MDKRIRVHNSRYSRAEIRKHRLIGVGVGLMLLAAAGLLAAFALQGCEASPPEASSSLSGTSGEGLPEGASGESGPSEAESDAPEEISSSESSPESKPEEPSSSAAEEENREDYRSSPYYEAELPILVNPSTLMPSDFEADVVDLGNGYKFDRKASAALGAMLDAAKADGMSLWIISAYRSLDRQKELYAQKVAEYESYGYSAEEAAVEAAAWVAVPGTSEHCLGYAVDLNSLEESFENTAEFAWLQEHCADYGFILRFPKDKVEITGISYEPWHYRYVGINHAKKIMSEKICLEEYLENA